MDFRQLFDDGSWTYTYLLAAGGEAVLIDTVFENHVRDAALVRELGLTLKYTLDTHAHADHVTGAWLMKQALGSRIAIAKAAGTEGADELLEDGAVIKFGERELLVRSTPGHTSGCLTFILDDRSMAFTGDCLLIRGAGRTDFQEGSAARLYRSIQEVIFTLPETCLIYPGHDYSGRTVTTVAEEKAHNPRVGGDANETDFVGYMDNLGLQHPKRIAIALPANLRCGEPEAGVEITSADDWGPVFRTYANIPEIDPTWVAANRASTIVVDVREAAELTDPEFGMIEGASHVPLGELAARAEEFGKEMPVVAVCRSGKRSAQATVILRRAGFTKLANISGGMIRWRALGLPTV